MTPRPTQTLRARLLIIFLAVALVPLVIMGWFSITTTEALISRMVLRQLQNLAQDKAALLEHWLGERKADITVMAGTSILRSMDPELIAPYLELMREKYGVYRDFALVSASGETVFTMGPAPASGRYTVRPDLFMSGISLLPGESESTFLIAAPVTDDAGRLAVTLYGRVGTARIPAGVRPSCPYGREPAACHRGPAPAHRNPDQPDRQRAGGHAGPRHRDHFGHGRPF